MIYVEKGKVKVDTTPINYVLNEGGDITVSEQEIKDCYKSFKTHHEFHAWGLININGFGVMDF
tara:strand:+ start:757 stop:945 length:189 start_codon:yes stop_codon:yes gene_type:complete